MEITLTSPSLLFPAVAFLLVAYTNRFLALGSRIRDLHSRYHIHPDKKLLAQIHSLRYRVALIRNMQACAVAGLFSCVFCILLLFEGFIFAGKIVFTISLLLFLTSLAISFREILLSVEALNLELSDIEQRCKKLDE
ncbi:MAG: DUF2721 domain-containing protein [Thermodesulfobacteriota bacterium]